MEHRCSLDIMALEELKDIKKTIWTNLIGQTTEFLASEDILRTVWLIY
jgi:hypothetical protein